jgi:hypothetical protein
MMPIVLPDGSFTDPPASFAATLPAAADFSVRVPVPARMPEPFVGPVLFELLSLLPQLASATASTAAAATTINLRPFNSVCMRSPL